MITGIHHVTAIASNAQRNVDFYSGVLGMRLVKKTVNFDDPGTYHLYYGDGMGRPGTILTFFPWPGASPGRRGTGQVATTLLSVPLGTLNWWKVHLLEQSVALLPDSKVDTEGNGILFFDDPDGMRLGLASDNAPGDGSGRGMIPPEFAIRGIWGVNLWEGRAEATRQFLREVIGFSSDEEQVGFVAAKGQSFDKVLVTVSDSTPGSALPRGLMGTGVVHHVAFRVADDATQAEWREKLIGLGFHVSPVMDRNYFHSIYFREPGGVLFEIATDPPGFTVDETEQSLGMGLKLPEQYEPLREQLEEVLPTLVVPYV
jgi:glyoxalase family protein